MDQTIRFCKAPDGVRIAYATAGFGYPLVVCQGWIGHLELDWANEHTRGFWEKLAEHYLVVRYDKRGTGLSDRNVEDYSLEAQAADLGAVVDALDVDRVALLGYSQGGPIALAYAHGHQERISQLVLYGTYANGHYAAVSELAAALWHLVEADWEGLGALAMADIYLPGAPTEVREAYADYQRHSASREVALAQAKTIGAWNVKGLLKEINIPALVMHKKGDKPVPFELGRRLARDLPRSRFMPLEGSSHIIWLGRPDITLNAIMEFLAGANVGEAAPATATTPNGIVTRREKDVLRLIAAGKSNRQIAADLCISVNTADRHVSNILTKIAASNRAQAASYAVRSGIAS